MSMPGFSAEHALAPQDSYRTRCESVESRQGVQPARYPGGAPAVLFWACFRNCYDRCIGTPEGCFGGCYTLCNWNPIIWF
jgi:hypothetical protein